jgi:hypothetical protein
LLRQSLGNAQITVTLVTYSHVLPGVQQKAVEAMNDMVPCRLQRHVQVDITLSERDIEVR